MSVTLPTSSYRGPIARARALEPDSGRRRAFHIQMGGGSVWLWWHNYCIEFPVLDALAALDALVDKEGAAELTAICGRRLHLARIGGEVLVTPERTAGIIVAVKELAAALDRAR